MAKFRQKNAAAAVRYAFYCPAAQLPGPRRPPFGLTGARTARMRRSLLPYSNKRLPRLQGCVLHPCGHTKSIHAAYEKYPCGTQKGPPLREGPLRPKAAAYSVFILLLLPNLPPRPDRSEDKRRRARLRWLRRPLPSPGRCGYRSSPARLPCRLPSASR